MLDIRIGIVTGSKVATKGDGAEPGRVLQAVITDPRDVQNVQTCQAGDEYNPPNGATVVLSAGGNAYKVALALDDGVAPVMGKGGRRIYAVDANGEAEVAEVRLHPDGTLEMFNGEASITEAPDGTVTITNASGGATLNPAGVWTFHGTSTVFDHMVTMPDATIGGKQFNAHKHGGVSPGSSQTTAPTA